MKENKNWRAQAVGSHGPPILASGAEVEKGPAAILEEVAGRLTTPMIEKEEAGITIKIEAGTDIIKAGTPETMTRCASGPLSEASH